VSGTPVISLQLILEAIQNLTIIAALILIYHFLPTDHLSRSKRTYSLWIGILFGFITAVSTPILWGHTNAPAMGNNIVLVPLAALAGGPLASALVAAVLILVSLILTGTMSLINIVTISGMVLLGSLFYYKTSWKYLSPSSPVRLILLGLGVVLIEVCSFLLFRALWAPAAPAPGLPPDAIILPFAVMSFLGTVLLGSLIGFINRKKEVERSLIFTNKQFNLALESARAHNWEADLETGELKYPDRVGDLSGYPPDEMPRTISEIKTLTHPEDLAAKEQSLQDYLNGKTEIYESTTRISDRSGFWRWYLSRGRAMEWDESGRPTRMIGVALDITGRKLAEEELKTAYLQILAAEEELHKQYDELAQNEQCIRESEEKYRAVVTLASDGILIIRDDVVRFINPKAAELFGRPSQDLINVPFISFVHPRERERVEAFYQGRMNGGLSPPVYETMIVKMNGEPVDIEVSAAAIMFEGKPAGLAVIRDISERKRSQKALENAKKKQNLLNYVTFTEIQNQIFTLLGYQQLAGTAMKEGGDKAAALLEKGKKVLQKITDSLKFAEAYQDLGLKPARWQNVRQVFLMAISHLDFQDTGHTITTDGLEIFADPLLEQVFQILADNTLIHGRTGTQVTLGYVQEPDESLVLVYGDNGIGIPDADKSRIFLPEFQEKKSMGLFLAREILETTEITIRETGRPGAGVRFEMRVPKGAYRFRTHH
jgi:PAS domain S-box-containing protein